MSPERAAELFREANPQYSDYVLHVWLSNGTRGYFKGALVPENLPDGTQVDIVMRESGRVGGLSYDFAVWARKEC